MRTLSVEEILMQVIHFVEGQSCPSDTLAKG